MHVTALPRPHSLITFCRLLLFLLFFLLLLLTLETAIFYILPHLIYSLLFWILYTQWKRRVTPIVCCFIGSNIRLINLRYYFIFFRNLLASGLFGNFRLDVVAGRGRGWFPIWYILYTRLSSHSWMFCAITFSWRFYWALLSMSHWLALGCRSLLCSWLFWPSCRRRLAWRHLLYWLRRHVDRNCWLGHTWYRCRLDSGRLNSEWPLINS